ncbi:peptidase [Haloarcula sp. S1CR25-12]|uniref:Peptidase n=1 Tax=Haloarcula saliterrae TaxID=2950534 RepID=A0ABU2FES5_9EURY|nr:CARDB domain-containing protein [Haloarcula sp. S1CR25-12]MDS0260759.1 peptidase [Haloarcula sp. S1CR25-12]
MRGPHHGWVAVSVAVFLVVSMAGTAVAVPVAIDQPDPAGGGQSSVAPAATATQTDDTIVQTERYALTPDRPGQVRVRLSYDVPDRVQSLEATLPAETTVTGTDGFSRVNETVYELDDGATSASIELRYNPNETTRRTGPEAASGRYLDVDAGEWALFRQLGVRSAWSYSGSSSDPVTFERRTRTAGPGVAGDNLVYLGSVTTVERTENGQTFRLAVPERAELAESPDSILDSLTNASGSFRVGDRDEDVVVVAAPTTQVEWAVRGATLGSDFWVRDFERLDEASNVWLHEYVHTRQAFSTTRETRWLVEATAQYYAAVLTLEQERITFDDFRRQLSTAERSAYDDVVLAEPATWTRNANYFKGALAAGRIDLALRASTNRSATLEETVRELNGLDSRVTQTRFLRAVERAGGADSRATAVAATETSDSLSMWDQSTHSRLFGVVPAQVGYALPNATDGYRASGPYRNETVSATPVRLATGETLTVDTVVSNTGGKAGTYNATLTVDGTAVTSATGEIAAESERTVRLAHTFERAGEYTLGAGGERVTVVVEPPAEPTVSGVSVDSQRVQRGESVVVTATVRNDAAVPANGTVAFTRDGEPVARQPVTLAPGASTQLSVAVPLPTVGETRLGAGAADPVTVTVAAPTAGTEPGTTGGSGAGFTVPAAVLAVALAVLARRNRAHKK